MTIPTPWPFPVYITGGKAHRVPPPAKQPKPAKPAPEQFEDALL